MKTLVPFLIFIFFFSFSYSQSIEMYNKKIDSLYLLEASLITQIDKIKTERNNLITQKNLMINNTFDNKGVMAILKDNKRVIKLRVQPEPLSESVAKLSAGDTVYIIAKVDFYYKVRYKGSLGYVSSQWFTDVKNSSKHDLIPKEKRAARIKEIEVVDRSSKVNILKRNGERKNKQTGKFSKTKIGYLNKAKGWMLNKDGQWDSLYGTIPVCLSTANSILLEYEKTGLGIDNYIEYQIRDFKYGDSTYIAIIKKFRHGTYSYPAIREGWNEYNTYEAFIINRESFIKMQNSIYDNVNLYELDILGKAYSNFESNEVKALKAMEIDFKIKSGKEKLIFHYIPFKSKNIVQFFIYETFSSGSVYLRNDFTGGFKTPKLFENCYYETSLDNFKKFITINK